MENILANIYNILNFKKKKFASHRTVVVDVYIIMAVLWFSWFQVCFSEPEKILIPTFVRYLSLVFFLLGVFLFIFSHIKMRGFVDKGQLITTGIFSKIRNPMYLGFIIWIIGFPIFLQKPITLISSIIWITHIIIWKVLEEKELEKTYPNYAEYKKKTWF